MKFISKLKVNIFLVLVILIKYTPLQIDIKYQYIPEILSLLIYVIYLQRSDLLKYMNIFFLSLFDDLLRLNYIGISIIQNSIYVFYIDILRKKYSSNILFDWLSFTILNIILLPIKYILLSFFKNCDIVSFDIFFKKAFVTIAFFPFIYYLTNKFIHNNKINA